MNEIPVTNIDDFFSDEKNNGDELINPYKNHEIEDLFPEEMIFLARNFVHKFKFENSFCFIDPEEIRFLNRRKESFTDGLVENCELYHYKRKFAGDEFTYLFYVYLYDGFYPPKNGEHHEDDENYRSGRLDFFTGEGDFLVNKGFSRIKDLNEIIKDLIRFIYSKNECEYLIVQASNNFLDFNKASNQYTYRDMVKKISREMRIQGINPTVINCIDNSFDVKSIEITDSEDVNKKVRIIFNNEESEKKFKQEYKLSSVLSIKNFINGFCSMIKNTKDLENQKGMIDFLNYLINNLHPNGEKKRRQRMRLYINRLENLGFDIKDDNGDVVETDSDLSGTNRIYAYFNENVLNNLFDFSDTDEMVFELLKKYLSKTNLISPDPADFQNWLSRNHKKIKDFLRACSNN